jgi:hypothetical protein
LICKGEDGGGGYKCGRGRDRFTICLLDSNDNGWLWMKMISNFIFNLQLSFFLFFGFFIVKLNLFFNKIGANLAFR